MSDKVKLSRRTALKSAAAGLIVAGTGAGGLVFGHENAWAMTAETLDGDTFATLVQMSRDTYPHSRLEDKFYAAAVSGLDKAAKDDAALKTMLTDGAARLDKEAMGMKAASYRTMSSEDDRLAILKSMQADPFFQKIRSNLVTGLYNNKEAWPLFGYPGESASQGGYIDRGFNDIDWL
ncbi:MAG: gluconate 2-dehydrogenase subunit 3 family protein [Anderseniella sp.]|nr:gluconate 2-dehydrogenase subunit 3 family protein [Anderseniella sp.]